MVTSLAAIAVLALTTAVMWMRPRTTSRAYVSGAAARTSANSRGGRASRPGTRRELPQQWPLNPRPLLNSRERSALQWLQDTFPDHLVMVKLAVTRYTIPREDAEARDWYDLLNGVYCTFAVCSAGGRVLGCVDVVSTSSRSRYAHELKERLLSQCGIGYWTFTESVKPDRAAIRADFLGDEASHPMPLSARQRDGELEKARHQLHELLDRQRDHRLSGQLSGGVTSGHGGFNDGSDWGASPYRQEDSFLAPWRDSRRTGLNRE